ncbi:hypothetical protein AERO9A_350040 [Aeromonas salmonicida]|nr:hypothetical protein AERO9A_350040 [Aeromonas salmonicida]
MVGCDSNLSRGEETGASDYAVPIEPMLSGEPQYPAIKKPAIRRVSCLLRFVGWVSCLVA